MKFILMSANLDPHYKYIEILFKNEFHEKLPDEDSGGSKHVANVHNKTNHNTIILLIYYKIIVLTVV
jgi:hypothetical protein